MQIYLYIISMKDRKLKRINIYIYLDQVNDLKELKKRDGIDPSESIRRAIDDWLVKKEVREKLLNHK